MVAMLLVLNAGAVVVVEEKIWSVNLNFSWSEFWLLLEIIGGLTLVGRLWSVWIWLTWS